MWRKILTLEWLFYNLKMMVALIFIFGPFHWRNYKIPAYFNPGGSTIIVIFMLVSSLTIYIPFIFFIASAINTNNFYPGYFIPITFGLAFGTFFRYISNNSTNQVIYDGRSLTHIIYGFYEKTENSYKKRQLKGIVLLRKKFQGTNNYKLCIELEDGKLIMLKLTIFKKKSQRLLSKYCELFELEHIQNPSSSKPINDMQYTNRS